MIWPVPRKWCYLTSQLYKMFYLLRGKKSLRFSFTNVAWMIWNFRGSAGSPKTGVLSGSFGKQRHACDAVGISLGVEFIPVGYRWVSQSPGKDIATKVKITKKVGFPSPTSEKKVVKGSPKLLNTAWWLDSLVLFWRFFFEKGTFYWFLLDKVTSGLLKTYHWWNTN